MKLTYQVRPQDVDFRKKITLSAMGDYLLETAGAHAASRGFGIDFLIGKGYTWVLSKWAVEMERWLDEGETFGVETWVEQVGRLTTARNFGITDATGETVGRARTQWAMIDYTTRRPVDLLSLDGLAEAATGVELPMAPPARLAALQTEGLTPMKMTVRYSDIDLNAHVTSMRYVRWLGDVFSLDFYERHAWKRFEINYVHEALFGDALHVYHAATGKDGIYRFEIRRGEDVIVRAGGVMG